MLAILALLAAAAFGAWWYFTQASTTDVPAVEGMPLDRAVSTLQDDDLKAGIVTQPSDAPQGTVFRQDPTAGTEVDDGSTVQLLVSGGPSTKAVPNAVGLDEAVARDRLVAAGFEVKSREVFSEEKPGMVVSQTSCGRRRCRGRRERDDRRLEGNRPGRRPERRRSVPG